MLPHLTLILSTLVLAASARGPRPGPGALRYANAQPDSSEVARVELYEGTFSLSRLARGGNSAEFRVRVNDAVVFRDSVSQRVILHTLAVWSGRRLALLELESGGSGCPATYRIVEWAGDRPPSVTPEFGTCSDLPVVLQDGARFRVRFPGFRADQVRRPGFAPPPAETWEYVAGGRVRKLAAAAGAARR